MFCVYYPLWMFFFSLHDYLFCINVLKPNLTGGEKKYMFWLLFNECFLLLGLGHVMSTQSGFQCNVFFPHVTFFSISVFFHFLLMLFHSSLQSIAFDTSVWQVGQFHLSYPKVLFCFWLNFLHLCLSFTLCFSFVFVTSSSLCICFMGLINMFWGAVPRFYFPRHLYVE